MNMPLVLLNRRRRGGSFSPYSLFSGTAIGTWFDPSDLSTMYQDAAGTTAVTTPGQPVGLRLDKSKGLVLGAELVANGDFSGGTTGWTLGAGWGVPGAELVGTGVNSGVYATSAAFGVTAGRSYKLTLSTAITSGSFSVRFDNGISEVNLGTISASGQYSFVVVAPDASSAVGLRAITTFTGTIDNISVRELAGNHATQSVLASRPVYGIEPAGGRRNLLTFSQDFDNAAWAKGGITVSSSVAAPDGSLTASRLIAGAANTSHTIESAGLMTVGAVYTTSFYVKYDSVRYFTINSQGSSLPAACFDLQTGTLATAVGGNVLSATITPAPSGWYYCVVTATAAFAKTSFALNNAPSNGFTSFAGDGVSGVYLWGAQLELGSTATAYQRVTSAFDVTEAGVQTCHYVQYDGSDDGMITNSIDFTATDKMSVFAGVRKLSDAAQGVVVELSATVVSNNGSFLLAAPDGATATFGFDSKGTTQVDAIASSLTAPISRIVTGLADIAGDRATIRIDGVQADQDTGDQGTGNFGNYAMFIGRRNNASLPFNGKDYGLIIVGKAASAGEITDTETWLAAKTAQVTI